MVFSILILSRFFFKFVSLQLGNSAVWKGANTSLLTWTLSFSLETGAPWGSLGLPRINFSAYLRECSVSNPLTSASCGRWSSRCCQICHRELSALGFPRINFSTRWNGGLDTASFSLFKISKSGLSFRVLDNPLYHYLHLGIAVLVIRDAIPKFPH